MIPPKWATKRTTTMGMAMAARCIRGHPTRGFLDFDRHGGRCCRHAAARAPDAQRDPPLLGGMVHRRRVDQPPRRPEGARGAARRLDARLRQLGADAESHRDPRHADRARRPALPRRHPVGDARRHALLARVGRPRRHDRDRVHRRSGTVGGLHARGRGVRRLSARGRALATLRGPAPEPARDPAAARRLTSRRSMAVRAVLLVAGFLALAVLETSPLVRHFTTHLGSQGTDALHQSWILAWDAHALTSDPRHLFDANLGYPLERSLAFSDHLLGTLPLFAPVYLSTGNVVAGFNTVMLLSAPLAAFGGFALAWWWTRRWWPSVVAGTLFGFGPLRLSQIGHLQMLTFFWAPWALLFLDRFLRMRRWRDLW